MYYVQYVLLLYYVLYYAHLVITSGRTQCHSRQYNLGWYMYMPAQGTIIHWMLPCIMYNTYYYCIMYCIMYYIMYYLILGYM